MRKKGRCFLLQQKYSLQRGKFTFSCRSVVFSASYKFNLRIADEQLNRGRLSSQLTKFKVLLRKCLVRVQTFISEFSLMDYIGIHPISPKINQSTKVCSLKSPSCKTLQTDACVQSGFVVCSFRVLICQRSAYRNGKTQTFGLVALWSDRCPQDKIT